MVEGTPNAGKSLEEIITSSDGGLFNNAAQAWNHMFFWNRLKPNGGAAPVGALLDRIKATFGSVNNFKSEFHNAAVGQFGSGWAWLVVDGGNLKITTTSNADNPQTHDQKPLLTVDVWEHAYYLDYQNRRPDFVGAVLDNLLNWDFVAHNLE